jgi:BASS family bile acid:Na+ symporter
MMTAEILSAEYVRDGLDGRQHGCYAAAMVLLDRPAAALAWLGRHGTIAVAASMFVGIALPPLGALIRPYFAETVIGLLLLAFLRVDPGALRAQWREPRLLLVAAVWTMLIQPVLALGMLAGTMHLIGGAFPASLALALVLHAVAPPTFSSPSLATLIGLNGAISLAVLIACTAITPLTSPALVAAFFGSEVSLSPLALGLRLVLILAGAALTALAIRAVAGKAWVERQAERLDGLSVLMLFGFAIALMGDVLPNTLTQPLLVLGLIALSTSVSVALTAATALAFLLSGREAAFTLGHTSGSRNMGLMLAAASAGSAPEFVWLYVALAQFPIYLLPLLYKPLVRRLMPRQDASP